MKPSAKQRVDQLMVDRGLAESRQKAQALVLAGEVTVNGRPVDKPGRAVALDADIRVKARPKYVSRGGLKLEAALETFGVDPDGKVCIDVGASTGGFTDCLLRHGARRVYAVDTGAGQIHWRLRNDPRVALRENKNARSLEPADIGEPADLIVCDASFISVKLLLPRFPALLKPEGEFIVLIKPQFEVGRGQVGKGGIVRDAELHRQACAKVREAVEAMGYEAAIAACPVRGAEGNQEFLLHARH
ncbi:MAG: 16S/23S rRNA (cytidine-2'-O)-methyltransferase TlyA [Bryobacteraceae bacterium]|nr:16S/23S rRNA (cytidine-2'-O)-methyltransferase TlyA [Bryobacteraceae bacterium]